MIFIYAKSAYQHPINSQTIQLYSSLEKVGERIIGEYVASACPYKLEAFIRQQRAFRVYQVDLDTGAPAKKVTGKKLLEELKKCEGLKAHFTKALLRS